VLSEISLVLDEMQVGREGNLQWGHPVGKRRKYAQLARFAIRSHANASLGFEGLRGGTRACIVVGIFLKIEGKQPLAQRRQRATRSAYEGLLWRSVGVPKRLAYKWAKVVSEKRWE
jgi:hypothetical protein